MKANEFDNKIKDQVKKIEHTAPTNVTWDINKSWDKISQLLKQASPKSLVWYFCTAASVSMVMANVSLIDYEWEDQMPKSSRALESPILKSTTTVLYQLADEPTLPPSYQVILVNSKSVAPLRTHNPIDPHADLIPLVQPISISDTEVVKASFKPQLNTAFATSGFRLSGELMLITNKKINNALLGMSLEMTSQIFNSARQETALSSRTQQALYMNMVVLNDKAKRPWSARIGTPLWQTNPGDSTAPMIKMNYQTRIGKRVHIGPEVIFSKGFKQVCPGISLSFG
jgi:hypothetical protein